MQPWCVQYNTSWYENEKICAQITEFKIYIIFPCIPDKYSPNNELYDQGARETA